MFTLKGTGLQPVAAPPPPPPLLTKSTNPLYHYLYQAVHHGNNKNNRENDPYVSHGFHPFLGVKVGGDTQNRTETFCLQGRCASVTTMPPWS
jgi:hypothetical protein